MILVTHKKRWNIWRYCIKVGHSGTFIWQLNVPLNAMVLDYLCLVWTSQKIDCSHGKSLSQGDFLGICLYACSTKSSAVRGHSITTWTRWGRGGGQKMFVFVHAQGIETVHAGGVKKWQNSVHVVVAWPLSATLIALMPMQCYVLSAFHTRIYSNRLTLWSRRLLHLTKEFKEW